MFQTQRLQKGDGFYETTKKVKLKTFANIKEKRVKTTNTEMTLRAERRLFATMILIAKNRQLDMQDVFCHPLGPLPWSLAIPDGTMRKTSKATFGNHLESMVELVLDVPQPRPTIIDAMALIQKLHGENHTFGEPSDYIFESVLHAGQRSERIDVVFDVYSEQSIKSAERVSRGSSDGVVLTVIRPDHKIQNWRRLLTCSDTKTKLSVWQIPRKTNPKRERLCTITMYVTNEDMCFKLTSINYKDVDVLRSNHEEADTRMILHAKHAADTFPAVIIVSDDTDVLIICLNSNCSMNGNLYLRRCTKARVRMIDINKLAAAIGNEVASAFLLDGM